MFLGDSLHFVEDRNALHVNSLFSLPYQIVMLKKCFFYLLGELIQGRPITFKYLMK
jgi:hypothetical protein